MTTSTFPGAPETWTRLPTQTLFSLSKSELEELQLHWAKQRFVDLRERVPALKSLADKQGVNEIADFDSLAAILFTHQVYKNYPMSFIENRRFGDLTRWLNKLTTHDLSALDMKGIQTIDEWLSRLDEAGMFIFHSTGTSGKLSFFPRSQTEKDAWVDATYKFMETFEPDIRDIHLPFFWPSYRTGRQASLRLISYFGPILAGSEAEYHSLFDAPLSADFLSLAMRMKYAQDRGDLKTMDTIQAIFKTKGALLTMKARKASVTRTFFEKMVKDYRGQRVFLMASATDLLNVATQGLKDGRLRVFAPNSLLLTGGGFKGQKEIADWKDILKKFYGVDQVFMSYGMTELNAYHPACPKGHYHLFPWNVALVLDMDGKLLPRTGAQTGRAGYFDLLAQTYWGGILTGDRVTVHYDDECGCGWEGPWIEDNVQRFTELLGGDDIISCAGVQSAYSDFMDYIAADVPEGE
jgi:hypothetical protein